MSNETRNENTRAVELTDDELDLAGGILFDFGTIYYSGIEAASSTSGSGGGFKFRTGKVTLPDYN